MARKSSWNGSPSLQENPPKHHTWETSAFPHHSLLVAHCPQTGFNSFLPRLSAPWDTFWGNQLGRGRPMDQPPNPHLFLTWHGNVCHSFPFAGFVWDVLCYKNTHLEANTPVWHAPLGIKIQPLFRAGFPLPPLRVLGALHQSTTEFLVYMLSSLKFMAMLSVSALSTERISDVHIQIFLSQLTQRKPKESHLVKSLFYSF